MIAASDVKLGLRMLRKYPGLTIAGGLALAIAIGLGAGWYDFSRDFLRPRLPLPERDRIVEIEMRDSMGGEDERRILHDFVTWRRDARSVEQIGAYRTIQPSLTRDRERLESVVAAETTASAFRVARVPPLLGRTLLDADEQRDAPAVAVLGYQVWQRLFAGRADAIGQRVQVDTTSAIVVGVMPEGFAFPINHQLWVPFQIRPAGYAPLEGVGIRVFGLLAPNATHTQANTEFEALTTRVTAASPQTHRFFRPRVLAYGGESAGSASLELSVTHIPILLVFVIACVTVGILMYARTATRDAEIATRYALGADRSRILSQLFAEALVLSSVAALVGLTAAHFGLKWGKGAFYSGLTGGAPFWTHTGLSFTTVLYAVGLAVASAAVLGVVPALKATSARAQSQLMSLGSGWSTRRFGRTWMAVMIGQVALTVMVLPPAIGIATEGLRDQVVRARFPVEDYLAVRLELDRQAGGTEESDAAFAGRRERTYAELERRLAQDPGIAAIAFGDRLPGMNVSVRRAEVEINPGEAPVATQEMWRAAVGPGYFEAFDKTIVAGRAFDASDRADAARTVIVNEAFARRRFMNGVNPIGHRVRYHAGNGEPGPWFEIVGIVQDFGVTPTDLGEAPYVFHPASAGTVAPYVMGVRVEGDREAVARRVRTTAAEIDSRIRISDLQSLDALAWRAEIEGALAGAVVAGIVLLGLFLTAVGLYSLTSVSVSRRMREIGLRSALGATPRRMLATIFARAVWLVSSGIVGGNVLLSLLFTFTTDPGRPIPIGFIVRGVMLTSGVMLAVALLACTSPARRALRIQPTEALRHL